MTRIAAMIAVAATAALTAVGAGAAGRPAYLAARCSDLAVRPVSVAPCGQNRQELLALRWRGWGTPRATATGSLYTNTCVPDCPSGEGRVDRVRVTADRLRSCRGGTRQYARLTYTPVVPGAIAAGHATFACL